jgi:hypothetical protein
MTSTLALLIVAGQAPLGPTPANHFSEKFLYPYGSPTFGRFVNRSFGGDAGAQKFYTWVDASIAHVHYKYPNRKSASLEAFLDYEHTVLSQPAPPETKAKNERRLAIWLHRMVKKILPHFDLDTGFEFKNCVEHGQRQCFLQSVLIAGCLQRAGLEAGVTMVNKNIAGQETNNKHAICLLKLPTGKDVIVDASEDYAFAKQQGLFTDSPSGYRFVKPVYDGDFSIAAYEGFGSGARLAVRTVEPMPNNFIASQFDYYRGERTVGGVMAKHKTVDGLASAANFLAKSVAEDPENSLSQYMLGRVFLYQRNRVSGARSLDKAMKLYDREGWIPPDERMAQAQAHKFS